ncbi:MAG: alpha amylase family protein, partial [bacterium]|nr:alpha amylase family protein [bacterium]
TWYCVEGSNQHLKSILDGNPFYGGILADQFYDNPEGLAESIKMNLKTSDGLMIFDIVHIIEKNMWKQVERGMREGGAIN